MDFPTVHRMRIEHAKAPTKPKPKTILQARAERLAPLVGSRAGELCDWTAGEMKTPRSACGEKTRAYLYECLCKMGRWVSARELAEYSGFAVVTVQIAMNMLRRDRSLEIEVKTYAGGGRFNGCGRGYLYRCTRSA